MFELCEQTDVQATTQSRFAVRVTFRSIRTYSIGKRKKQSMYWKKPKKGDQPVCLNVCWPCQIVAPCCVSSVYSVWCSITDNALASTKSSSLLLIPGLAEQHNTSPEQEGVNKHTCSGSNVWVWCAQTGDGSRCAACTLQDKTRSCLAMTLCVPEVVLQPTWMP